MEMKGTIVCLFICGSTLVLSAVANAQTIDHQECTQATLNGTHGLLHDDIAFGEDGHLA